MRGALSRTDRFFSHQSCRIPALSTRLATPVGRVGDLLRERVYGLRLAERTRGRTTYRRWIVKRVIHSGTQIVSRTCVAMRIEGHLRLTSSRRSRMCDSASGGHRERDREEGWGARGLSGSVCRPGRRDHGRMRGHRAMASRSPKGSGYGASYESCCHGSQHHGENAEQDEHAGHDEHPIEAAGRGFRVRRHAAFWTASSSGPSTER